MTLLRGIVRSGRILEIATDVGIRDTYGVKDGDIVEVEVS